MFSNSYRSVNNSEWLLSNFCCKSTRSITSSNLGKKNIFFWIIDLLSYSISDSTSKFLLSLKLILNIFLIFLQNFLILKHKNFIYTYY
jgi:hypothetical protein